jgi:hypothetical protein
MLSRTIGRISPVMRRSFRSALKYAPPLAATELFFTRRSYAKSLVKLEPIYSNDRPQVYDFPNRIWDEYRISDRRFARGSDCVELDRLLKSGHKDDANKLCNQLMFVKMYHDIYENVGVICIDGVDSCIQYGYSHIEFITIDLMNANCRFGKYSCYSDKLNIIGTDTIDSNAKLNKYGLFSWNYFPLKKYAYYGVTPRQAHTILSMTSDNIELSKRNLVVLLDTRPPTKHIIDMLSRIEYNVEIINYVIDQYGSVDDDYYRSVVTEFRNLLLTGFHR